MNNKIVQSSLCDSRNERTDSSLWAAFIVQGDRYTRHHYIFKDTFRYVGFNPMACLLRLSVYIKTSFQLETLLTC